MSSLADDDPEVREECPGLVPVRPWIDRQHGGTEVSRQRRTCRRAGTSAAARGPCPPRSAGLPRRTAPAFERVLDGLAAMPDNTYLHGHFVFDAELHQRAREAGISIVFLYRDPRAALPSLAHFLLDRSEPATLARRLPGRDLERRCGSSWMVTPRRRRFRTSTPPYEGWKDAEDVIVVRFEDIIGPRGGGSLGVQFGVLTPLAERIGWRGEPGRLAAAIGGTFNPGAPARSVGGRSTAGAMICANCGARCSGSVSGHSDDGGGTSIAWSPGPRSSLRRRTPRRHCPPVGVSIRARWESPPCAPGSVGPADVRPGGPDGPATHSWLHWLLALPAAPAGRGPDEAPLAEQSGQAPVSVDAAVGLAGRTVGRLAFAVVDRRQLGPTDEARLPGAVVDAQVRSAIGP